ncbi:MAG: hypothetical protein B7Y35_05965 [Sphingomonadales bacterium 28-64-96]|nr:MAG: hypothetical protein B7Y35_05965 [Sphingomonadales bacterium 28-64-96]
MADRPILFSAPMVRALLEGRKTQTRRVLKHGDHLPDDCVLHAGMVILRNTHTGVRQDVHIPLPYAPGGRLWVKETYAYVGTSDPGWLLYRADDYEGNYVDDSRSS